MNTSQPLGGLVNCWILGPSPRVFHPVGVGLGPRICISMEFPLWFIRLRTRPVSTRVQVPSLALLSGFRIWRCCERQHKRRRCGSDPELLWLWGSSSLTPSLGTTMFLECSPKKHKYINKNLHFQLVPTKRWCSAPESKL